ncbi:MAG: EF-P lysine aminoacylase EpmA [Proteobacteria bacterium]|jgi:lysyl-tRNA synthetase class 2|nr:EF-P lysine aminoacylase EpmA [Pseudomonadota bacterium]
MTRKEGAGAERARLEGLARRLGLRAAIVRALRRFFEDEGFLEVETPIRVPAPAPEEHIDPEPSGDRFLAASPELQMKRLVASGAYPRIFQVSRCFRRGERGALHLPEFTLLEWYRAGAGIDSLMADCESMIGRAARAVGVSIAAPPWERLEVADAFERFAGWRPSGAPDAERFTRDLVDRVEPSLPRERPVFLAGYPASMASLARIDPANPARAERFELYAAGLELANGFAELTDPSEQRARFEAEIGSRRRRGAACPPIDEAFLEALELGMPACAGIALGVDRLAMWLTGATSIDEVVAFPEGTA